MEEPDPRPVVALCADSQYDPEMWHPTYDTPTESIQAAKAICNVCPYRVECKKLGKKRYGIWGGVLMRLGEVDDDC